MGCGSSSQPEAAASPSTNEAAAAPEKQPEPTKDPAPQPAAATPDKPKVDPNLQDDPIDKPPTGDRSAETSNRRASRSKEPKKNRRSSVPREMLEEECASAVAEHLANKQAAGAAVESNGASPKPRGRGGRRSSVPKADLEMECAAAVAARSAINQQTGEVLSSQMPADDMMMDDSMMMDPEEVSK